MVRTNKEIMQNLTCEVENLTKRVAFLEAKLVQQEAQLFIATHTSDILSCEIDKMNQYSQRSCLIVDGLKLPTAHESENVEEKVKNIFQNDLEIPAEVVDAEFDKAHRVGPIIDDGQKVIVRFKSHNFRSKLYHKRKLIKNHKIKFRVSLTKKRRNLLAYAEDILKDCLEVAFVFADFNGFPFFTETDLARILEILGECSHSPEAKIIALNWL